MWLVLAAVSVLSLYTYVKLLRLNNAAVHLQRSYRMTHDEFDQQMRIALEDSDLAQLIALKTFGFTGDTQKPFQVANMASSIETDTYKQKGKSDHQLVGELILF